MSKPAQYVEFEGRALTLKEWADEYGLAYTTLFGRLARGWKFKDAITRSPRPMVAVVGAKWTTAKK